MNWITIALLTISSSLDNFGAGLSYGICGIRIRIMHNALIALIAFLFSYTGIICGGCIAKILPNLLANVTAALLFFVIGLRLVLLTWQQRKRNEQVEAEKKTE